MVLRNNNFIENNNCYETSILYKSETNNNFKLIEESLESYKNKLLSSYWTEINLIGYKIKLLDKQKVEYPKEELKNRIIYIGNKISGIIEVNKRKCFNCRVTQTKQCHNLLKEHYLCEQCGAYKRIYGKFRSKELWFKTKKDRNCSICDVIHTSQWHRYLKPGQYLCAACYIKQKRMKKSTKNTKANC
uniref:GATA-type domain-containing protein n=1 Tax=Meloidogyne incognita TaxID=6306 RepID=A0A914NUJ0_MELIC